MPGPRHRPAPAPEPVVQQGHGCGATGHPREEPRGTRMKSCCHPICFEWNWKNSNGDPMEQLDRLVNDLSDIPFVTDPDLVRQKSFDCFWFSPILDRQLHDCTAQVVVRPRNEDDVIRLATACVRHKVPITARGGGTGIY